MIVKRLGFDFDGVFHDSLDLAVIAANKVFEEIKERPITADDVRRYITSDWTKYFDDLGIPREKHHLVRPLFKKYEKEQPLGPLVSNSRWLLALALQRYGQENVVIVSNSQDEKVADFLKQNKLPRISTYIVSGSKSPKLLELGVTTYVGDMVSDGEAAVAVGARFIGLTHYPSFNHPDRLAEFKRLHPKHEIYLANGLHDATRFI